MKKEAVQDERYDSYTTWYWHAYVFQPRSDCKLIQYFRLKRPPNEEEFANPLDEMPVMDILEAEKEYNNNQQVKIIDF